jgi:AcrR family transcriptional regulator
MPAEAPRRRGRPPSGQREAILAATLALVPERGIAKLTTREIASEAGVSEASVYYHFGDRAGLLLAAFEQGVQPLNEIRELELEGRGEHDSDRRQPLVDVLGRIGDKLEGFLDQVFPVVVAAQSDPELHAALTDYMREHDLGPHRGVRGLGGYLKAEQDAGRLEPEIDTDAAALMLIGACFIRVAQSQLYGDVGKLPSLERVATTLALLLADRRVG